MDEQGYTPLSPFRFQSQLGKELKRVYKEGNNIVRLSLARVTKVNYKYNTVEVMTTLHKDSTVKNPNDNGRYSARLPVTFGGKTPDGRVYGNNTLVTIGSLVLIGFIEGNKDNPIVLNIYGEADNQSQLTRTTLSSADESDEAIQGELWQLFSLYPSMTYKNIDGRGNQEVTFTGKSFMYITDTDQENAYVNDRGFDYDHLPSARYANGDLIEPTSPNAPTVLYVHQAVYDNHRVTFFIKSDGTVRLASRNVNGKGITYQELGTDGSFSIVQKRDTTDPEAASKAFSSMSIEKSGNIVLQGIKHKLEITDTGVLVDGQTISDFISGGGGLGETVTLLEDSLTNVQTSITVMNGKIETKISQTTYDVDLQGIRDYAKGLSDGVQADVTAVSKDVSDLNTYVDGAFKDGVITDAEAKSIATYIHTLGNDKAHLDSRYTEISANTYLDATDKTGLDNAKSDYDNSYSALINTINLSIADDVIKTDEKNSVDTAFATYSSYLAALSKAFETAINAIATAKAKEAEDHAKGYVDGEITTVNSTITQLANEIDLKVDSTTYTSKITDVDAKQAATDQTLTTHQATLATQQQTIDNTVKNIPYRVQLLSTNGLQFKNGNISTTIIATVYHGTQDITSTLTPSNFIWSRISDDAPGDDAWNAAHVGAGASIQVTAADVPTNATFECDIDITTT